MLVSDLQNPDNHFDVDADRHVSPLDALLVINHLSSHLDRVSGPAAEAEGQKSYPDTNGDTLVSPIDALLVINELNAHAESVSEPIDTTGFVSVPVAQLPGNSSQFVSLEIVQSVTSNQLREVGFFVMDNAAGDVAGVPRSHADYARTLLASVGHQTLASRANVAVQQSATSMAFAGGSRLGIYVLQSQVPERLPSEYLRVTSLSSQSMRIGWEEHQSVWPGLPLVGDRGYDDAIIDIRIGDPVDGFTAPTLDAISDKSVDELTSLVFNVSATDADLPNDALTFSLVAAPAGAVIDSQTGEFRWTPSESQGPGQFDMGVRVTDEQGHMADTSFRVTVNEVNLPPVLGLIGDRVAPLETLISFPATAADPDLPANNLTFSLGPNAPPGATIDSATGQFSWTPDSTFANSIVPITIRVADNGTPSLSDSKTFRITLSGCSTGIDDLLTGWTVLESGGTENGKGTVVSSNCAATLTEGDSFVVGLSREFTVPNTPSAIAITYDNLNFDTTDPNFINDAFEIAFVDRDGNSLIKTIAGGRDAFFNITEGLVAATGSGVQVNGNTVTIGLNGIPVGTDAKLIFRLANNDSDTRTTVRITGVETISSDLTATLPGGTNTSTIATLAAQSSSARNDLEVSRFMASVDASVSTSVISSSPLGLRVSNATLFPSNLTLTDAALERGFEISTFASGFPTIDGIGPLGIAFPDTGGVVVTDYPGNLWHFSDDVDGQSVANATRLSAFGNRVAIDLETANGKLYITTRDGNGRVLELNSDGTVAQEIAADLGGNIVGIAASPIRDPDGHQHLFVAAFAAGIVWDIDPIDKSKTQFLSVGFDGLSTDGRILYGADLTNSRILGYDIATKALVFDSGPIPGRVDGTALGTGSLAGKIYGNTNTAGVWEIDLVTKEQIQIAGGPNASRGDFVSVAPDGTLLITQSDQIARLIPPLGGGFGNFEVGVNVSTPSSEALAGTTVLLTGNAFSTRLSDGARQVITHVLVNGTPVDLLDTSGNIFNQVEIQPGVNTFSFTAFDESGQFLGLRLTSPLNRRASRVI